MHRSKLVVNLALIAAALTVGATQSGATTVIILRSHHRIVLATDSRAIYGANGQTTECKLFEIQQVYATVSGLAHYGGSYRSTDAIRAGFARTGSFEDHIAVTASTLKYNVEKLLAGLQVNNPGEYRSLIGRQNGTADLVQLALAQTVKGRQMLGIIELRSNGRDTLSVKTTVCPARCSGDAGIYYLGYWERIKPYVTSSGQLRSIGSAASLDRLIRLEINAHPSEVGAPINILELNDSGARWLQNGGNCSLPGVGW